MNNSISPVEQSLISLICDSGADLVEWDCSPESSVLPVTFYFFMVAFGSMEMWQLK